MFSCCGLIGPTLCPIEIWLFILVPLKNSGVLSPPEPAPTVLSTACRCNMVGAKLSGNTCTNWSISVYVGSLDPNQKEWDKSKVTCTILALFFWGVHGSFYNYFTRWFCSKQFVQYISCLPRPCAQAYWGLDILVPTTERHSRSTGLELWWRAWSAMDRVQCNVVSYPHR